MKINGKIVIILMLTLGVMSCGEYEQLERKKLLIIQADSIFATQRDSLRKYYDTICDNNHKLYYTEALDSIKAKQIEEIRYLIDN